MGQRIEDSSRSIWIEAGQQACGAASGFPARSDRLRSAQGGGGRVGRAERRPRPNPDSPYSTRSCRFLPVLRRQDRGGGKDVAAPLPAILFRTKIPTCDAFTSVVVLGNSEWSEFLMIRDRGAVGGTPAPASRETPDVVHLIRRKKMIVFPWLGLLSSCFISAVVAGFIFYKYGLGSKEEETPLQSRNLCCSENYHDKQALNLSWLSIKSIAAAHGF